MTAWGQYYIDQTIDNPTPKKFSLFPKFYMIISTTIAPKPYIDHN